MRMQRGSTPRGTRSPRPDSRARDGGRSSFAEDRQSGSSAVTRHACFIISARPPSAQLALTEGRTNDVEPQGIQAHAATNACIPALSPRLRFDLTVGIWHHWRMTPAVIPVWRGPLRLRCDRSRTSSLGILDPRESSLLKALARCGVVSTSCTLGAGGGRP